MINCKEHIMKMCRQGSDNLPFSTNLPYQSETHFNKYAINVIINVIDENSLLNTRLTLFSIDYKSFDDNKVFDINAFDVR